ncbi:gp58-like family protein, partial [Streptococcus suis]|uniref:gp58-like family protein n=1 Tax=Streptococcus suis TaxID=1307 RepID=UPI0021174BD4
TTFNKLDKIYPEIGLLVGDSYEWVAMGEYFVNDISIDRNRNTTELDLMDGMFKLNQPYVSDLTYPAQIRDVIREICVKTGIELETDNLGLKAIQRHIEAKADKKDITFREVLSQAIQLLGFSAFFNRKGKLEVRGLTESRITVTADNYFLHGLTKSEIQYQIAGITCKKDKETLTVGLRTGRSLELENSFMNQNLLDELYYELKDIKYYPFSLDWQGHLKLDVGQWVTLKTNKNETYKVPVLSQSFSFKGGLKSKISADSKAGNDTQYSYKGFLTKQIEQMSTQIDAEIQQQLEYANAEFDRKTEEYKKELNDGIEKSKAEAEAYADTIKREISTRIKELDSQFQTNQQEQDRQIEESLRKAGTSTDLANVAKNIAESTQANIEQTRAALTNLVNQSTVKVNQMEQSVGTIRTDVASQARTLLAQAQAQTDLTNRVTTVETLADGTRSTVAELSKTVSKATGDITSVISRTKTVEDTLNQTRTQYEALTQTVNTQTGQIDSVSRRTATLETGLDGVTQRFESLQVGGRNYIRDFGFANLGRLFTNTSSWKFERVVDAMAKSGYHLKATCTGAGTGGMGADFFDLRGADWQGKMMTFAVDIKCSKPVRLKYGCEAFEDASSQLIDVTTGWKRYSSSSKVQFNRWHGFIFYNHTGRWEVGDVLYIRDPQLEDGNIATTPHAAEEDLRSEIATYKRTAEESSAELSRQIQLADGKAVEAKSYAQQTTDAIKTRLESLETYKNEEGTRAEQYLSASRTETAKQLSAERTVISANYVAKSTFEENARDVTQRFESLRVGGRNLIPGTATFSGGHWDKIGTWRLEESLYKGAGILTWVSGLKASPIANISVQSGDTYTFSAYIKKENAGTVYFYLYDEHETWFAAANVPRATLIRDVGNNFQRFTITFKVTRSGILKPRFAILSTDEGGFSVAGYQLENGTVATDWSPAPEDQQIYTETKIAEYKTTVDGRFATLQESVDSKANQVDFQSVKETAQLYERIIGSTEAGIKDKVARMVMADSLFQTDVRDAISGTATQVNQLGNSWAVKNLTSAGTVLNQLNLNKDGSVKIDGKLVQITGTTYIQDGVITSAKIASLDAGKITSGYISAERLDANSITAAKLKVDRAFFDALAANKLLVKEFFAKDAVVTSIQAVTLSATQIKSGVLKAFNDRTTLDLSTGKLTFNNGSPSIEFNSDTSAIRRVSNGQSQFLKFAYTNGATYTTIGANRRANDESIGTADFTGFQIQSRSTANGSLIDKIYAYTDEFIVDGGGGQSDGFVFKNRQYLYPQLSGMLNLGRLGNRWQNVYSFDYYVGQNAVSLRAFLDAVRACFQQIAYGGMTQTTYDLLKNKLSTTLNKI